ncbi:MAG: hypothetical protein LIP23_02560 [Planctomycetes bacterium]|nr:hypothetical protein [Planctomycetota bacterium]
MARHPLRPASAGFILMALTCLTAPAADVDVSLMAGDGGNARFNRIVFENQPARLGRAEYEPPAGELLKRPAMLLQSPPAIVFSKPQFMRWKNIVPVRSAATGETPTYALFNYRADNPERGRGMFGFFLPEFF